MSYHQLFCGLVKKTEQVKDSVLYVTASLARKAVHLAVLLFSGNTLKLWLITMLN